MDPECVSYREKGIRNVLLGKNQKKMPKIRIKDHLIFSLVGGGIKYKCLPVCFVTNFLNRVIFSTDPTLVPLVPKKKRGQQANQSLFGWIHGIFEF